MNKKITPLPRLVKHERASKDFDIDLYYTTDHMYYYSTHPEVGEVMLFVPRGYLTDGASVPKVFQKLFPVWDTYTQAAIFHDYLCEYLTIYTCDNMTPVKLTRTEADRYFNELMKVLDTNKIKRKLVNAAVVANSHLRSIIYPSAIVTKRQYENEIRRELDLMDGI